MTALFPTLIFLRRLRLNKLFFLTTRFTVIDLSNLLRLLVDIFGLCYISVENSEILRINLSSTYDISIRISCGNDRTTNGIAASCLSTLEPSWSGVILTMMRQRDARKRDLGSILYKSIVSRDSAKDVREKDK